MAALWSLYETKKVLVRKRFSVLEREKPSRGAAALSRIEHAHSPLSAISFQSTYTT
jgi:hypothetical protein